MDMRTLRGSPGTGTGPRSLHRAANAGLPGRSIFLPLLLLFLVAGTALAQEPPEFSRSISSLFPGRSFNTCTQGQHEEPREVPHVWFLRARQPGELTIDVRAVAVNVVEESGSITARLYDGQDLLGRVAVDYPTGQAAQNGDENTGVIGPVRVRASTVLRLEVERSRPAGTVGEGHHYNLGFSDVGGVRIDVGVSSPVFRYLEGTPQVFHVNIGPGENFRLALLTVEDAPSPPPAASATVEVRYGETGEVLIPKSTVSLPHTLSADNASAGTVVVDISPAQGHYRLDKESGSDKGVYFDTCLPVVSNFGQIPIVDAHSQVDTEIYSNDTDDEIPGDGTPGRFDTDIETIINRMRSNGVTHTILSPRVNDVHPKELLAFSDLHPEMITQAVVTKGACQKSDAACDAKAADYGIEDFDGDGTVEYEDFLDNQMALSGIDAMGEYLSFHAQKGEVAGEVMVPLTDDRTRKALDRALSRGWPFVVHIEFAALEEDPDYGTTVRNEYMHDLVALLREYPDYPFVLIHMGQLEINEARYLLATYPNIHFFPSHSNPLDASSGQPWVNLFERERALPPFGPWVLKSEWKALISRFPDRFIFAIDNVFFTHWDTEYGQVISLWRDAFDTLLPRVAHAVAHCNAERLWNLPPQGGLGARMQCLSAEVNRVVTPNGLQTALFASIRAAIESLKDGHTEAVRGQLKAFVNKIKAQAGRNISQADAARLIRLANRIIGGL